MGLIKLIRKSKLKNKNFTIFTNNCLAGFIYQRYALPYLTPTIGMNIKPSDFIKFCKNYKYYTSLEPVETKDYNQDWFSSIGGGEINFPVGKLDDILLYFQHAHSFDEAKDDWNRRRVRINQNNTFFILYDTEPSIEVYKEFHKIDVKNKLYLYHKGEYINSEDAFYIKDFKPGLSWWGRMNKKNPFSKRFYEQFDYTKWFNENTI